MTTLLLEDPSHSRPSLPERGIQTPRIFSCPPYAATWGPRAIELAAIAGLYLDEWQQHDLTAALGVKADNKSWAASDVGIVVPRQNGKGGLLEARQLTGLFLIEDERLQIHTAHLAETSLESFNRLAALVEETPRLSRHLRKNGIHRANGKEGITLRNGKRIKFRTRTSGGGRGLTGDVVYFDEAMIISEATIAAVSFVLAARRNTQTWFTGSAVDQTVHPLGVPFARIRERGLKGNDPELVYCEYSLPGELNKITEDEAMDPASWARGNPAYGIRIFDRAIIAERGKTSLRSFCVERLGVGDWPSTDEGAGKVISPARWLSLVDRDSQVLDPVCLAFDVTPKRDMACISAAGLREDGLYHVEVVEHAAGTGWVAGRLAELKRRHRPRTILYDPSGPAASLAQDLELRGVPVVPVTAKDYSSACGIFYDAVMDERLVHGGTEELAAAIDGAAKRPVGEAWGWARRLSTVDISPLVSVTLALFAASARRGPAKFVNLADALRGDA